MFALKESDETASFAVPPTKDCKTRGSKLPRSLRSFWGTRKPERGGGATQREHRPRYTEPYEQNTTNYTGDMENRQPPYP